MCHKHSRYVGMQNGLPSDLALVTWDDPGEGSVFQKKMHLVPRIIHLSQTSCLLSFQ